MVLIMIIIMNVINSTDKTGEGVWVWVRSKTNQKEADWLVTADELVTCELDPPGGHGGEDGGDGEHSPFSGDGGRGSGVDIQKFPLREFDLQFGKYGVKAGGGGGGGGGVVVLGHNPPELRDHEPSDGEGWGAGVRTKDFLFQTFEEKNRF